MSKPSKSQLSPIEELQRQKTRERRIRRWQAANVPQRHAKRIEGMDQCKPWADKLASLSGKLGQGYLFAITGPRGAGKTQLAVELIRAAVCRDMTARYTRLNEMMLNIRDSFTSGTSEREVIDGYTSPQLLIIDEAHEGTGSDPMQSRLNLIVDKRYAAELDTIMISNDNPQTFTASVGTTIADRMVETGGIIVCDWPSFRGVKK